jgi:hypothetical protein
MTRLRKRSAFRPRVIQPPSPDDTRGPTPERMRRAQGFVERGNLGRGRTGIITTYFGGRTIEKVARIFRRATPGSDRGVMQCKTCSPGVR